MCASNVSLKVICQFTRRKNLILSLCFSAAGNPKCLVSLKTRVFGRYLAIPIQRRKVEEKGLPQRNTVDWIVQIVALVQFHLKQIKGAGSNQQQWNIINFKCSYYCHTSSVNKANRTDNVGRCSGDVMMFPLRSN